MTRESNDPYTLTQSIARSLVELDKALATEAKLVAQLDVLCARIAPLMPAAYLILHTGPSYERTTFCLSRDETGQVMAELIETESPDEVSWLTPAEEPDPVTEPIGPPPVITADRDLFAAVAADESNFHQDRAC